MKEYKVVTFSSTSSDEETTAQLNAFAKQGWSVVSAGGGLAGTIPTVMGFFRVVLEREA